MYVSPAFLGVGAGDLGSGDVRLLIWALHWVGVAAMAWRVWAALCKLSLLAGGCFARALKLSTLIGFPGCDTIGVVDCVRQMA